MLHVVGDYVQVSLAIQKSEINGLPLSSELPLAEASGIRAEPYYKQVRDLMIPARSRLRATLAIQKLKINK